jgi:hypothetical protein
VPATTGRILPRDRDADRRPAHRRDRRDRDVDAIAMRRGGAVATRVPSRRAIGARLARADGATARARSSAAPLSPAPTPRRRRRRRSDERSTARLSRRPERGRDVESLPAPLVWTFDGPFERCLDDLDDSLRRAIVLIGDVSRVALLIDISLPDAARARPPRRPRPAGVGPLHRRIAGYGLPTFPRVRHLRAPGPLATLVVAYRS